MEQALYEPVELTEFELDQVAGGNPFSVTNNGAFSTAFPNGSFAIGVVQGDMSTASGLFVGQLYLFGINNHPTTSIVNAVDNSINVG